MRLSDDELREVDKVIVIAAGTAFHAGLIAEDAIEHWTRIPCEVELASELPLPRPDLRPLDAGDRDQPVGETMDT
jgi:glucosamine--fructose-6-phosphate aminotransferase (isomerizing)